MTKKKYKLPDQEYHTEKLKEWRQEQKKKGLCRYCKNPVEPGRTMCAKHLEYHKWHKKLGGKNKNGKQTNRAQDKGG